MSREQQLQIPPEKVIANSPLMDRANFCLAVTRVSVILSLIPYFSLGSWEPRAISHVLRAVSSDPLKLALEICLRTPRKPIAPEKFH
jgi:hypothetical protein